MDIQDLLARPPRPRSELAERAGVSRNTEWTLRHDLSRARLSTIREIALACGYDVDVTVRRTYDPAAIAAARELLGDLGPDELAGSSPTRAELDAWRDRLERYAASGADEADPLAIAVEAAAFAAPQAASGAIMLSGRNDLARLMSAATAASELPAHAWAVSGRPALEALGAAAPNSPAVVWTTLPERFRELLGETHRTVNTTRAADLVIGPLAPVHLAGAGEVDGVPFVAPVQAVIDSLGFGGELAAVARSIAERW